MKKLSELNLLEKESLFRVLRTQITHHSNAIEGLTLSYQETKALLETGNTANNKPLDEQLIILGFAKAYDLIIREANDKNRILDDSFIKDLHYLIFSNAMDIIPNIKKPIGAYRTDNVIIKGVDIELTAPNKISQELNNLLYSFPSNNMDLTQIALFHAIFEKIHPFIDGNGRVGRLIMSFQALQNDMLPPLIENKEKDKYLHYLYALQQDNNNSQFADFLQTCQEKSLALVNSVENERNRKILENNKSHKITKMKQSKKDYGFEM